MSERYRVTTPLVVVHTWSDVYPARNGIGLVHVLHGRLLPWTTLPGDIEKLLAAGMIEPVAADAGADDAA
jgi:hypothetical protein